jgi:predicted NAD/FAD-binding protein
MLRGHAKLGSLVKRVAVVGGGISGMVAAYLLKDRADVVLFEAAPRLGGHAHTVDAELGGRTVPVDTAVVVFNDRTYPLFNRLLGKLGVETVVTHMGLSVRDDERRVEYSTHDPRSFLSLWPKVFTRLPYQLAFDLPRFYRVARRYADDPSTSLGEVLERHRFGEAIVDHVVLPLTATVWSVDFMRSRELPFSAWWRFVCNHGLATPRDLPTWFAFPRGTRAYVDVLARLLGERVRLWTPVTRIARTADAIWVTPRGEEPERFDEVIIALHADVAARVLQGASDAEAEALRDIPFVTNDAALHTDARVMPRRRQAWSSWNYHMRNRGDGAATVTYYMNRLQRLEAQESLLVSLNQTSWLDPGRVLARFEYDHPRYSARALAAQKRLVELSGRDRIHFCGAYLGIGFHEDGVRCAVDVARRFGVEDPFADAPVAPRHATSPVQEPITL